MNPSMGLGWGILPQTLPRGRGGKRAGKWRGKYAPNQAEATSGLVQYAVLGSAVAPPIAV